MLCFQSHNKFFFFNTGSDILTLSHYNFSAPKVEIVDHNPIRDCLKFSDSLVQRQKVWKESGEMSACCAYLQQKWNRELQDG